MCSDFPAGTPYQSSNKRCQRPYRFWKVRWKRCESRDNDLQKHLGGVTEIAEELVDEGAATYRHSHQPLPWA